MACLQGKEKLLSTFTDAFLETQEGTISKVRMGLVIGGKKIFNSFGDSTKISCKNYQYEKKKEQNKTERKGRTNNVCL